ncbi:MAG: bifunctional N(6)-L-threonylcarbamoyladenine synthase/serine/threonine protein kinase [Candidatus Hydrothermarchaeales archaeon]
MRLYGVEGALRLLCLGIEATAEKLGAGIVSSSGKILSNIVKRPPLVGGIHPREAAQHHAENIKDTLSKSLEKAGKDLGDINLIAFSKGPGLGPCLRVGAISARTIALSREIPILGANHCLAHIEIGRLLTGAKDPLALYVSGGNTQVIAYADAKYRVFGETLDIAIGNCIDQFARALNLGNPGGPIVEDIAKKGSYISLPYVVKGMDLSFSGLLTAAKRAAEKHSIENVCHSLQENAFSMIVEVTERALAYTEKEELMLVGGVGANGRLQEMLRTMSEEHGARFLVPDKEVLGDNGAMIAWLGILMYNSGIRHEIGDTAVKQKYRTDEVEVTWRI